MSFLDFNLQADFIKSIENAGFESPTALQSQLIPLLGERRSVIVKTQSASGKTGAFLIPAMNYILENPAPEKRGARILILTSRRDRVSQINYTIKRLSQDHSMRFGFIVSGRPYQTQMRLMRRPLDIMIATPGRLNDLMNNGKADFSQLEMLILDDLTSIYKKGLHPLVEKIINQADENCSVLTFISDDSNDEINNYTESLIPDSVQITAKDLGSDIKQQSENTKVTKQKHSKKKPEVPPAKTKKIITIPDTLTPQVVHIADDYTHKIAMMDHLMDEFAGEPTLIYTATNKAAKTLQDNLSNHGHTAELIDDIEGNNYDDVDILIHSDQQKTTLDADFYSKTDTHIIHFDLPRKTEQYLNRLTNHQQSEDDEILLMVDGYNYNELKHIEKTLGKTLKQITVPGLEPLNPFINLSRSKPSHNKGRTKQSSKKPNNRNNKQKNSKPNNKKNNHSKNTKAKNTKHHNNQHTNQTNSDENQTDSQRRQRKGPFGRLNGGAQRKKSGSRDNNHPQGQNQGRNRNNNRRNAKVGVSTRGTAPPPGSGGDRGWKATVVSPQERKTENTKPVVIRYSKKRILSDKPEKPEDS